MIRVGCTTHATSLALVLAVSIVLDMLEIVSFGVV